MRVWLWVGLWLTWTVAGHAQAQEWRFDTLRQLIDREHVDSVERLIGVLPEELRAHYALVFASRSLQDANFENPRAILFGRTAQFILTFNGHESQHGFAAVETMEFDPATSGFVFREVSFQPGANPPVQISEANPARCVACHGNPARPIWDVPPLWPGVYGERYGAGLSTVEQQGLRRFLAAQPAHPRYRHLINAGALLDRDTYVASARDSYNGVAPEPPNARLSKLLGNMNVRAILSQLAAQPGFTAYLKALLAASGAGCGSIVDFFPMALHDGVAADMRDFMDTAHDANRLQATSKGQRRVSREHGYAAVGVADPAELRYLAERGLGVSTQHWTLAFERGTYDLAAPSGTVTLEAALYQWLARVDSGLAKVATYRTFNPDDAYCSHLRDASRADLGAWFVQHPTWVPTARHAPLAHLPVRQLSPPGAPAALQQCIACHDSGAAPALPFNDLPALAAQLREGGYTHGRLLDEILFRLTPQAGSARMPRGSNLDAAEQRSLENYFIELAHLP